MKKLLLGFMALTMMLIIALVVAPSFIDWTNYRNGIAAEIERVMNRRVVIDGAVDAALLPTPRLSMRKARLGNLPGASSPTMAEAEALEVRVAFWPLLSGRVVVTSVVLRKPVIELEVLPDGRRNWLFTGSSSSTIRLRPDPPEETPDDVRFENATVDDGTIIYRDGRSGVEKRVEGVNARFAAEGLYGPLRAAGELRYGGLPLRFSLSTGRFDPRGLTATPVNLAVEIPADRRSEPARGGGNFTGTFRLPDTGPRFNGQLKLRAEDLTSFAAALGAGDDTPFVLAQPFNLEGELELKDGMLNGNDLSVRLGETRAQGAVSAWMSGDEPQFDVALSIGRIDFDAWLAAAAKKRRAQEDSGAVHEAKEFILPLGVHVTLDAAADALTYRGGAMRQVKLAAEMADGVIDIHQLSMQLPGSTDGLFTGKLLAADGRPRVDGFAELSSNDFRNLLAWLDLDAADLPAGRLNTVSATSHLAVTGEMLELGDLDLQFDNTRVKGAMVAALRDRPAFGMNLIVDQLDLDSYLSGGAPVSPEGAAVATSQA
ncbi:MAG TPA: AsmA family protein, partial [Lacipirellula sp.]